ncbi:MAG: hypothetical protein IT438_01975 [Phycisphaerales bacterium]|nr:hypothetical protein [Phycisphaerales bacterium]
MVIHEEGSKHLFRVYLPEARTVELVGTFTDWRAEPIRMLREPTGWWTARVELPPDDHLFSYLIDGATWMADYAASGVRANGYGGWVSQLHVPQQATVVSSRGFALAA